MTKKVKTVEDAINEELDKWEKDEHNHGEVERVHHSSFNEAFSLTQRFSDYQLLFAFQLGDTVQVSVEYRGISIREVFKASKVMLALMARMRE